jgi:hypothetical protein
MPQIARSSKEMCFARERLSCNQLIQLFESSLLAAFLVRQTASLPRLAGFLATADPSAHQPQRIASRGPLLPVAQDCPSGCPCPDPSVMFVGHATRSRTPSTIISGQPREQVSTRASTP